MCSLITAASERAGWCRQLSAIPTFMAVLPSSPANDPPMRRSRQLAACSGSKGRPLACPEPSGQISGAGRALRGCGGMADAADSKSASRKGVGVQVPSPAPSRINGLERFRSVESVRQTGSGNQMATTRCSDLTADEKAALIDLLAGTIESDALPSSTRIARLRSILAKLRGDPAPATTGHEKTKQLLGAQLTRARRR